MGLFDRFKKNKYQEWDDEDDDDLDENESGESGANLTIGGNLELKVFHPTSLEHLLPAIDYLAIGSTLLLNLEGVDGALRRRMVDFISGAAYALDACIKKATQDSFFVAPKTVDVSGEIFDTNNDNEVFTDL